MPFPSRRSFSRRRSNRSGSVKNSVVAVEAIQNAYRVVWIERGDELAADVLDGLHVARGDEAGGADERERDGVTW